jgi:hypothetical protein
MVIDISLFRGVVPLPPHYKRKNLPTFPELKHITEEEVRFAYAQLTLTASNEKRVADERAKVLLEKEGIMWTESVDLIADMQKSWGQRSLDEVWPRIYKDGEIRNLTANELSHFQLALQYSEDDWSNSWLSSFRRPRIVRGGKVYQSWIENMAKRIGVDFYATVMLRYGAWNDRPGLTNDEHLRNYRYSMAWLPRHVVYPMAYDQSLESALGDFLWWVGVVARDRPPQLGANNDSFWARVETPMWKALLQSTENVSGYNFIESVKASMPSIWKDKAVLVRYDEVSS